MADKNHIQMRRRKKELAGDETWKTTRTDPRSGSEEDEMNGEKEKRTRRTPIVAQKLGILTRRSRDQTRGIGFVLRGIRISFRGQFTIFHFSLFMYLQRSPFVRAI